MVDVAVAPPELTYLFMRFVIDHLPIASSAVRHRWLGELVEIETIALIATLALNYRHRRQPRGYGRQRP